MAEKATAASTTTAGTTSPDARYRRLMIIWIVAFLLAGVEFFVAYKWLRVYYADGYGRPQNWLIGLGVLAIAEFAGSIFLWRWIQAEARKTRDSAKAESAYLMVWALCLASGALGYVILLSADSRYYFAFFILAGLGILYHQPAREALFAEVQKVEPTKRSAAAVKRKAAAEPALDPVAPAADTELLNDIKPESEADLIGGESIDADSR